MAFYSVEAGRSVDRIPHREEYERWRGRLTDERFGRIRDELLAMVDGGGIRTAGWMPGRDWTGTPWKPIYADGCDGDGAVPGRCFGVSYGPC